MNERIESYLKQHHCRDYFNSYGDTVEDEHYFMYREEVDGLIELIVQECVGVVEGGRFLHDDAPTARFAKECNSAIKRHFGVE